MNTSVQWKEGMEFIGSVDDHNVPMDAKSPIGKSSAATPKELVAMGLAGCTAMDVIAFLKKFKQMPKKFHVDADVQTSSSGHPVVFEKANLTFNVEGEIDPEKLKEAVHLSQTKYCGVSAMLSKAFPIEYRILLNKQEIGQGSAQF